MQQQRWLGNLQTLQKCGFPYWPGCRQVHPRQKQVTCIVSSWTYGLDIATGTTKKILAFVNTIEMCYHLRNFQLVLPFSFLGNLIQSSISGSKIVSVINGKTSPGGSYTTFKNWIAEKGKIQLPCLSGVIYIFFNNIGNYVLKKLSHQHWQNQECRYHNYWNLNLIGSQ